MKSVEFIINMFDAPVFIIRKFGTEDLAERMAFFQKNISCKVLNFLTSKSKINLLVHGDPWYNNFLYR